MGSISKLASSLGSVGTVSNTPIIPPPSERIVAEAELKRIDPAGLGPEKSPVLLMRQGLGSILVSSSSSLGCTLLVVVDAISDIAS